MEFSFSTIILFNFVCFSHNRQFRFEERDKEGLVKGHYGYYDKHGKLQLVHYDAHPHTGFHVESNDDQSENED